MTQPRTITASPCQHETGATLTIDLTAIVANWRFLADKAAPGECAAVVKADAYGCGIPEVVTALSAAGAKTFFVAHLFEARKVMAAAPAATVYVLNGMAPGSAAMLAGLGLRPVLGSMAEIDEWAALATPASAAIHIDTGMNRLGLSVAEARTVAERHSAGKLGFQPSLVMSHLACADEPEHPLNARQRATFEIARGLFPDIPASLANSAGTLQGDVRHDLCRPGIALYGGNPFATRLNPMQPVVQLESRIIQVRATPAGETVGYGARQTLKRPSRIAVLSTGYADGYFRLAGSTDDAPGAEAIVAEHRCPLIGRISMDLIAIDVTDAPSAARGDMAVLLGDGIGVDDLAAHAGTIGYEVLTSLGRRYHRTYKT